MFTNSIIVSIKSCNENKDEIRIYNNNTYNGSESQTEAKEVIWYID